MQRRLTRGQSMVEMALLFPVLILILFGIIDFGYYIYAHSAIDNAARRGSESASIAPPAVGATGGKCVVNIRAQAKLNAEVLDLKDEDITVSYASGATRAVGQPVLVTVDYTGAWLTPLGPLFTLKPTFRITSTSRRSIMGVDTSYC